LTHPFGADKKYIVMTEPAEIAPPPRRSRRLLVITLAVVILLVAVIAARQLASRGTPSEAPAADCEEEPPSESFTLADCDADPAAQPKSEPQRR
jgi:hypothetical protein